MTCIDTLVKAYVGAIITACDTKKLRPWYDALRIAYVLQRRGYNEKVVDLTFAVREDNYSMECGFTACCNVLSPNITNLFKSD